MTATLFHMSCFNVKNTHLYGCIHSSSHTHNTIQLFDCMYALYFHGAHTQVFVSFLFSFFVLSFLLVSKMVKINHAVTTRNSYHGKRKHEHV